MLEPAIAATGETIRGILVPKMKAIQLIIDTVVLPALTALWKYFGEEILEVFEKVKIAIVFFTDEVLPAIKTVWEEKVRPALTGIWATLTTAVVPAVETTKEKFNELSSDFALGAAAMRGNAGLLKKDTLTDFGAIHQSVDDDLKGSSPFAELTDFVWPLVTEAWEEHLKPTFQALWDFISLNILPTLEELKQVWGVVWGAIKFIIKVAALTIETAVGTITAVIRGVIALLEGDWAGAWQAAQDFVEEVLEFILGFFRIFGVDLDKVWKGIWTGIKKDF